jgi:hypothetical protein
MAVLNMPAYVVHRITTHVCMHTSSLNISLIYSGSRCSDILYANRHLSDIQSLQEELYKERRARQSAMVRRDTQSVSLYVYIEVLVGWAEVCKKAHYEGV